MKNYISIPSEHHRNTAGSSLDEQILVWPSCACSLWWDLLFCVLLRNHRSPWSLREPCFIQWPCTERKQGVKWQEQEGFFKTRFAKLCFVTSTGCSFWKNIFVFKSRATPSASQALWVAMCPRESVCYLRPSELFGRFWLHRSWSPVVQEHKVHLCPSRSRRKSLEIINNSRCSIKRFLE